MATTALVTGASSGLGAEFARLFAADNISVVLVARREDRLQQLKDELEARFGVSVRIIPADLTEPGGVRRVVDVLEGDRVDVEYLVNNAGYGMSGSLHDIPLDVTLGQIVLNASALTELTHRMLPSMLARKRGRILNVGSTAGDQPGPFMAVYYASKAYVNSFSEALHYELKGTGVSVTLSCPGPTFTEFPAVANVERERLFQITAMPADVVARQAYRAMMNGARRITHGGTNRIGAQLVRLAPRSMLLRIVAMLNSSK